MYACTRTISTVGTVNILPLKRNVKGEFAKKWRAASQRADYSLALNFIFDFDILDTVRQN